MDAQAFWRVIGSYNEQTGWVQIVLLLVLLSALVLSCAGTIPWAAKFALGIGHLWIAAAFFAWHGTQLIQRYFALPLFLTCGILFLYESWHSREDALQRPRGLRGVLLLLYLLYPAISALLGNRFPQMVTHIMPCPIASLGIAVYTGYRKKNPVLLALLTIWGLTGIKSVLFHVYEDMILLLCGIYGAAAWLRERKLRLGQ